MPTRYCALHKSRTKSEFLICKELMVSWRVCAVGKLAEIEGRYPVRFSKGRNQHVQRSGLSVSGWDFSLFGHTRCSASWGNCLKCHFKCIQSENCLGGERPLRPSSLTFLPALPRWPLSHVPRCHKSLQGWGLHCCPEQLCQGKTSLSIKEFSQYPI